MLREHLTHNDVNMKVVFMEARITTMQLHHCGNAFCGAPAPQKKA